MLALLMGLGENFEQFFPNCNRLSLVTDHLPMLYISVSIFLVLSYPGQAIHTSDPTAWSLNIFLTQNLILFSKATD
jgi:hypothetical protein